MSTAATALPPKTYLHIVPNSRYITAKGEELIFVGGQLTTNDPVVIADLDAQIKLGNNMLRVAGTKAAANVVPEKIVADITEAAAAAIEEIAGTNGTGAVAALKARQAAV